MLGHWSSVGTGNPFTQRLLSSAKYVVSRSADASVDFPNSTLVVGEAVDTVAELKVTTHVPLRIIGSGAHVQSLHAAGLIDRYTLLIHPIVLGGGRRLFGPSDRVDLQLDRTLPTSTGVVIAEYTVLHAGRD